MQEPDLYRTILDQLPYGVCLVDRDLKVCFWSRTAQRMTGFSSDDVVGKRCVDDLLACADKDDVCLCDAGCPLVSTLEDGKERQAELLIRHKDGRKLSVHVRYSAIEDDGSFGEIRGVVQIFFDTVPRMMSGERFRESGDAELLDPLTSLPNRRYLEDELAVRLSELDRLGTPFGILFLRVEQLAEIRKTHSPEASDDVIGAVAKALVEHSRPMDALGRWSSDELFAIIRNVGRSGLLKAAERLRFLIKKTEVSLPQGSLKPGVSIGGAIARRGDNVETLLERADRMLSECQVGGKNRVRIEGR